MHAWIRSFRSLAQDSPKLGGKALSDPGVATKPLQERVQEPLSHRALRRWERMQWENYAECATIIARFKTHVERRWDSAWHADSKFAFEGLPVVGDSCISPFQLDEGVQPCSGLPDVDEGHAPVTDGLLPLSS